MTAFERPAITYRSFLRLGVAGAFHRFDSCQAHFPSEDRDRDDDPVARVGPAHFEERMRSGLAEDGAGAESNLVACGTGRCNQGREQLAELGGIDVGRRRLDQLAGEDNAVRDPLAEELQRLAEEVPQVDAFHPHAR